MNGNVLLGAVAAGAVVILLGLIALVWWNRGDRRRHPSDAWERPEAQVFGGDPMPETPIPSSEDDYRFLLAGRVFWQPLHSGGLVAHADPRALAREAVVRRAAVITRTAPPTDPVFAGHRVAAALGATQPDASQQVRAWATEVTIRVPDEDAGRLHRLADLRKTVQVWEHERGHERNVREYLGDDVLTSTGKAVVWWLARHDYDVEDAVRLLGTLDRVSAAAQDRLDSAMPLQVDAATDDRWLSAPSDSTAPDGAAFDPVQGLDDRFFPDRDDARRKFFAHDLVKIAEDHELPGLAARIRAVFDLPDLADQSDGSLPEGEDGPPDPPGDDSPRPPGSG
jgi:hypothetical protein